MQTPTDALADLAFRPLPEIAAVLRHLGLAVVRETPAELTLRFPHGIAGGLTLDTDPINRAVVLAFLLGGQEWHRIWPGLLAAVNVRWAAQGPGPRQPPPPAETTDQLRMEL